jgi:hypothetical protein
VQVQRTKVAHYPNSVVGQVLICIAAELAAVLVHDLPSDLRKIVEAHFFDGESIFKIQCRLKLKRRDLEAMIEAVRVADAVQGQNCSERALSHLVHGRLRNLK